MEQKYMQWFRQDGCPIGRPMPYEDEAEVSASQHLARGALLRTGTKAQLVAMGVDAGDFEEA